MPTFTQRSLVLASFTALLACAPGSPPEATDGGRGADTGAVDGGRDAGADAPTIDAYAGPAFVDRCVPGEAPGIPAPLRTFYVEAATGDDAASGTTLATAWRTLDRANREVRAGDLVLLNGTFAGQQLAPMASGTAAAPIVFRARTSRGAILDGGLDGTAISISTRDFIVIDGLDVTHVDRAMYVLACTDTWVRNTHFSDAGDVHIALGSHGRYEDNDFRDCRNNCLALYDLSPGNQILRNTIRGSVDAAIYATGNTSDAAPLDTLIAHNDISNPLGINVYLYAAAARTTLECNRIHDAGTMGGTGYYQPSVFVSSNDNVVRYNLVYDNALEGISIWGIEGFGASRNRIYNNTQWHNGGPSFRMLVHGDATVEDNRIQNNLFWDNDLDGDSHWNADGTAWRLVVDLYHDPTPWPEGSLAGNVFDHNLMGTDASSAGGRLMEIIRNTGTGYYTLAEARAVLPAGALDGVVEEDPRMFDAAAGAVQLTAGSAAIDVGVPIDGESYAGAAPDLGRYESQP